jgi:hypothetical protein
MDTDLVAQLRRMVSEPTDTTYTDELLWSMIEAQSVKDADGYSPDDDDWTATYNIYKVAADIWAEKASGYVTQHDFDADGGKFNRSQKYQNAIRMSQFYLSKSKVVSVKFLQEPVLTGLTVDGWEDFPYKDDEDDSNILYAGN